MYASRTQKVILLTDFSDFILQLSYLIKTFEQKNIHLKIEYDKDVGIVKIFNDKVTTLSKAEDGLDYLYELVYDTAEHHPYWNLLYQSILISRIILDKWNEDEKNGNNGLTDDNIKEIKWSIRELENIMKRFSK